MQIVPRSFRFVSFCFVAGGGRRGKDREEISKKFLNREGGRGGGKRGSLHNGKCWCWREKGYLAN